MGGTVVANGVCGDCSARPELLTQVPSFYRRHIATDRFFDEVMHTGELIAPRRGFDERD